jgi:hypothetical protein
MKLVMDINRYLYKIIHAPLVLQYWINRKKFPSHMKEHIYWKALDAAKKVTPFSRQTFLSKHKTGMCGVGKFMKHWKQ